MHTLIYSYDYRNLYSCHLYEINMKKNLEKRLNIALKKPLYKQEYILSLA